MAATEFIAAIELGSTEITGIAGKKNADGSIQVLAYAAEHSSDCIKKEQSIIWIKRRRALLRLSKNWRNSFRLQSRKCM